MMEKELGRGGRDHSDVMLRSTSGRHGISSGLLSCAFGSWLISALGLSPFISCGVRFAGASYA